MLFTNLYVLGTTPVSLITDILRQIFFFIDSIVYSLIPVIYNMIFSLYDLSTLFGDSTKLNEIVKNLSTTAYSFLAIVMFFRSAFSLLTMLVDPARIDDKEQGARKMIINIVLCLGLIVLVPRAFDVAKKLQTKIMEDRIIEKVVIGENFGSNGKNYNLGDDFALSTWGVFLAKIDSDNNAAYNKAYDQVFNSNSDVRVQTALSGLGRQLNTTNSVTGFLAHIPGMELLVNLGNDISTAAGGSYAHYNLSYIWLLSTIAGVYVLWTFIKMMMDIAYRSIKFFALELISPIAIVSYIDPNSSKKGLFSKWLKETWSTYLSLFVRVFVFSIASVLLSSFSLSDIGTGNSLAVKTGNTIIVKIFYIIALCAFMKNAPKLIDDLFGTTMSKGSDVKAGREMFTSILGGGVGMAAGGISGAVAAGRTGKSAFKGAVVGAWNGGKNGLSNGKKGGMVGVVNSGIGAVKDQNKKYGLEIDPEREKLINQLEGRVDSIDKAKADATKALEANDRAGYLSILNTGAKYNGRKYGKGLEKDDTLRNTIYKNTGGLARDEMLHSDDAEYLRLRRLVYDRKNGEALATRTLENAKEDFEDNRNYYMQSVSLENKPNHILTFAADTAKSRLQSFNTESRDAKIDIIAKATGMNEATIKAMSDTDLIATYQTHLQTEINNLATRISGMSEAQLSEEFAKQNAARIEATYGNTLGNMVSDAAKAQGDAKAAQDGLDDYIKTKGKKIKDIDSAYAIADTRHIAKKKEKERMEAEERRRQQQNNNNNNGNNTP